MAAPKGNKNALKFTKEKSEEMLLKAIELSNIKEDCETPYGKKIKGYRFDFIGEIARELDTYHQKFKEVSETYPELKQLYTKLISNIQSNCYFNTKKGIIREATGIVNLKSNHRWTDRVAETSTVTYSDDYKRALEKAKKTNGDDSN